MLDGMLIKKGTNLEEYGFTLGHDDYYFISLNCIESNDLEQQLYLVVDKKGNLMIQSQIEPIRKKHLQWQDSMYASPSILVKMIKDGVVE